jgi:hypothetical protein
MIAIATVLLVLFAAICSIPFSVHAAQCVVRSGHRVEGILIFGFGAFTAATLTIVGVLMGRDGPGLMRFQALISIAAFFGVGAALGKLLHLLGLLWQRRSSTKT